MQVVKEGVLRQPQGIYRRQVLWLMGERLDQAIEVVCDLMSRD